MTDSRSPADITDALRRTLDCDSEDVQRQYRELYDWMVAKGKNPRREIGHSESTADNYMDRLDQLHRFAIKYLDPGDQTTIQDQHADALLRMIDRAEITKQRGKNRGDEYGESTKRKFANTLETYFKWRYQEGAMDYEWDPKLNFSDNKGESAYRFTYRELGLLFDEAESHGSLPSYYDTPEEERKEINGLVAQRLGIPKENVTRKDWMHADWSQKTHSLVPVSYDAGLSPVEVANAKTQWYDRQTKKFKIPTEYACKEREKEEVGLADETAEALSKWLRERRHLEKYDGTNNLWLNRDGNPYSSGSLCNLIRTLCEKADIKTEGRKIVWYSLRQTMGRNVTDEGELSEANDQLRHELLETTQANYNQTPVEKLQARLNETRRKAEKSAADPEYNPYEEEDPQPAGRSSASTTPEPTHHSDDSGDLIRQTQGGNTYVDAVIPDTPEAKIDVATKILEDETEE